MSLTGVWLFECFLSALSSCAVQSRRATRFVLAVEVFLLAPPRGFAAAFGLLRALFELLAARRGFAAATFVLPRAAFEAGFFFGERFALTVFRAFLANADTVSVAVSPALTASFFAPSKPITPASLTTLPALSARFLAPSKPAFAVSPTAFCAVDKIPSCSLSTLSLLLQRSSKRPTRARAPCRWLLPKPVPEIPIV